MTAGRGRGAAIALLLAAATSIQFGAAFAVSLFDRLGPGGTVFLRLAFAAAVLLAVWRPRLRGRTRADLALAGTFGLVLGGMNWAFYEALERIPLGVTVTLEFVGPLTVAVLGSRRPLDIAWVVLAAAGIVLLSDPTGASEALDPVGVVLALLAGTLWGVYIVLSARTGRAWAGASGLAVAMPVAALVALPAGVTQGGEALLAPELLAAGVVVALASSVIPYSLEMEALRTLPQAAFGVLMSLEPAIAALAGFLILGQNLGAAQAVAIACVVAASAGAAVSVRPTEPVPPPP